MADITARELRRDTSEILRRVETGERIRVTRDGRPVALVAPIGQSPWISGVAVERILREAPVDDGLLADVAPIRGEQASDR